MPSAYVRNLAKETGKSEAEIEKLWNKAKEITAETLGTAEKDFGSREYRYTVGIVKNMLGVKEELVDPSRFLNSELGAKEYLEAVLVSSNFSIGSVFPPEEDEKEKEDLGIIDSLNGFSKSLEKKNVIPEEEVSDDDDVKGEPEDGTYPVDDLDKVIDSAL